MIRRLAISLAAATLLAVGAASSASADTLVSTNWAGYAVTGPSFRHVSTRWIEPKGVCDTGQTSYSSVWIGLGGFTDGSPGLEQTGTDLNCGRSGRATHDAWYEMVPAPSHAIHMKIHGGDRMFAAVTVRGKRVTLVLRNRTTHRTFVKHATMKRPGTESAEWIVEAPSGCTIDGHCDVLPLGNFGTMRFTSASATSATGRTGTIKTPGWKRSKIILSEGDAGNSGATAVPSALSPFGASFSVDYHPAGEFTGFAKRRVFPSTPLAGKPHSHPFIPR